MEETENQGKKFTRIIQTISSENNENLMRLISKKTLTSYTVKHSFFTLIVYLVTFLGHRKENFYINMSCIHGTFPLVLEKTVHLWTSEKNISSSV